MEKSGASLGDVVLAHPHHQLLLVTNRGVVISIEEAIDGSVLVTQRTVPRPTDFPKVIQGDQHERHSHRLTPE